ncbi:MAG: hypothetical protein OXD36_17875 [Rhodobacter sp.]|nr:hypothetical protein [Rhodobacter sp.]
MSVSRMILVAVPLPHDFCRGGNAFRSRNEHGVSGAPGRTAFSPYDTPSYTMHLVNHAWPNYVTEGYAVARAVAQLREPTQKSADRIKALMT